MAATAAAPSGWTLVREASVDDPASADEQCVERLREGCGIAGHDLRGRERPFTQTTRRRQRRLGPHGAGRTTNATEQQNGSAACWSGTTVATTAIDPDAAANHGGLVADDPADGKLGRLSEAIKQPRVSFGSG
jgi:hypothetical protein